LSFNANKIITSGGGGMIIFKDKNLYKKGIYLASQAKDNSTYFIHNTVGYNFRLSSLHSSVGSAQISQISKIIKKKKMIHDLYKKEINKINGLTILEQPHYCVSNFWLNILIIDRNKYGLSKDQIIKNFLGKKIETRSVWYPNHLQRPFKNFQKYKIKNSKKLYENSLCLPSSFNLRIKDQIKVINFLKKKFR